LEQETGLCAIYFLGLKENPIACGEQTRSNKSFDSEDA
jgi:hypothetical protein